MVTAIDLNADLGEECGDDAAIFPLLSSANIACGAHAGSERSMRESLAHAAECSVSVGAHVSYPDRANFGRADMMIAAAALRSSIEAQIETLSNLAQEYGLQIRYVKPHGALYHRIAMDKQHAQAFVSAVRAQTDGLDLLVPRSAALKDIAAPNVCVHEFFADRNYNSDGTLVSRESAHAHVTSIDDIVSRTIAWLDSGVVRTPTGDAVEVRAKSICIHGDSESAVDAARALHSAITQAGIRITSWQEP